MMGEVRLDVEGLDRLEWDLSGYTDANLDVPPSVGARALTALRCLRSIVERRSHGICLDDFELAFQAARAVKAEAIEAGRIWTRDEVAKRLAQMRGPTDMEGGELMPTGRITPETGLRASTGDTTMTDGSIGEKAAAYHRQQVLEEQRWRTDTADLRRRAFGRALRDARVAWGLSLREAAALLGVTTVRLGEVERGVRTPDGHR